MIAACTSRFINTRRAFSKLAQSPRCSRRLSTNNPALLARPQRQPCKLSRRNKSMPVMVLPCEPVMPMTGTLAMSPGAKLCATISRPTWRALPTAGFRCIKSPGPAFTSTIAPPCTRRGFEISSATKSIPAISSPTMRAAVQAKAATSGCTCSVQSMATLPLR